MLNDVYIRQMLHSYAYYQLCYSSGTLIFHFPLQTSKFITFFLTVSLSWSRLF